ncbi:MAG TPA: DUF5719 family protein [Chloroflexota bacterium]|nr:DUF5719 family protein [Chloroflexota bacterium]
MYIRPRHAVRACIVAGLVFAALPLTPAAPGGIWTSPAGAAPIAITGLTPSLIRQAQRGPIDVIMLLRRGNGAAVLHDLEATGASRILSLDIVHGLAARVSAQTLEALRGNPELAAITLDHKYQVYPAPNAAEMNQHLAKSGVRAVSQVPAGHTLVSEPNTLSLIRADLAHKQFTGKGTRVAILDSGIDLGQPDLKGVVATGSDGKPLYADFTGTDLTDTVGHGTACAGTIAGQARTIYVTNDTYRAEVYPAAKPGQRFDDKTYFTFGGVAPGVKLMIGKVLDARAPFLFTTDSNLVRAIGWAVENHADVISESWGTNFPFVTDGVDIVSLADEAAVQAGVTVVAADGNSGPGQGTLGSPATAPDVIAAGASTNLDNFAETGIFANYGKITPDNIAYFTSHGPTSDGRNRPDVYAPGDGGWATFPRNYAQDSPTAPPYTIGYFGGTSMATPVIAGVAAMVIGAYESTHHGRRPSPAYVKQVILSSADTMGYPAADQAAGRVDALRAIQTVLRQGPSILLSGSPSLYGEPGNRPSHAITVINSGSTPERVTFQNPVLHQTKALSFKGTLVADDLYPFQFIVPAGVNKLTASINFQSQITIPKPSPQKASNLSVRLMIYDPQNNLVNYAESSQAGSGFTSTTVGHPVPGRWTAVVSEIPAVDAHHVRHYINAGFTGHIALGRFFSEPPMVSPSQVTLRPGQTTHVTFTAARLTSPGVSVFTVQAREHDLAPVPTGSTAPGDQIATIPVVVTTAIPIRNGYGLFGGAYTGGVGDQGFATETKYFTFVAPAHMRTLQVSIAWQHPGNFFWVSLIDPNGKITNLEDNALINPQDPSGPPDLSQRTIDGYLINPTPGVWRVTVLNSTPAGLYPTEQLRGIVAFDQPFARLSTSTITAQAGGGAAPFTIKVANTGLGVEGYLTYATSDQYQYLPLGGTGGVLQDGPLGATSTQVISYTTAFVPPGTQKIVTQAETLNGNAPLDVQMSDPIAETYQGFGVPTKVAISGKTGQGTVTAVQGNTLPSGNWFVQLSVPGHASTKPIYVAASTQGYALAPQPWVTMDAQFGKNLTINASGFFQGNLVAALPQKGSTIHGTIKVPQGVAPGTYHAHIYVLTSLFDQLANLPLTITVSAPAPQPVPTVDPLLATIASTQYFPEGATGQGLTDNVDLVNPGNVDAHAQVRLLTDSGWTTVTRYDIPPRSRRTVNLQPLVGDNQSIATLVQGDQPLVSGRAITRVDASGSYSVGAPDTARRWYFADGYTVGSFEEYLTFLNPGNSTAHVHIHLVNDQGGTKDATTTVAPSSRTTIRVADIVSEQALSAVATSDVPVVAERTQIFAGGRQGLATTVGATATLTTGYIDPGHLPSHAQAHLILFNPGPSVAHVHLAIITTRGGIASRRVLVLRAGHRSTIDLSASAGTANLGLSFSSDQGIVAEKTAYFGQFTRSMVGGSSLFATGSPSAAQVFPGGATAGGATDTIGIYNPSTISAQARVTGLFGAGQRVSRTVTVPALGRISLKARDLGIPGSNSSIIVEGVGGAKFYATQSLINAAGDSGTEVAGVPYVAQ